jgi:hypothetical protein
MLNVKCPHFIKSRIRPDIEGDSQGVLNAFIDATEAHLPTGLSHYVDGVGILLRDDLKEEH